jgi:hypothetical protein
LRSTSGEHAEFSATEFVSIPSQLSYSRELRPGLTLGLGYFVPQASNFVLRESLGISSGDERTDWQLALGATRTTHTFGAALGLQLSRTIRLGFGLIGTYEVQSSSMSIVATARRGDEQTAFAVTSSLSNFSQVGLEPNVGFQFDLSRRFTLALSARGPRGLLYQSAHASVALGSADTRSIGAVVEEPREGNTGLHVVRAGRLGAGLAFRPTPGSCVAIEADIQPGLNNQRANVNRRTVFNVRLGGLYSLSDIFSLGAGVFTDRSPDPRSGDALSGRGHFYGATLGAELGRRHRLHPAEQAEALLLSTTVALKYAYSKGAFNELVVGREPAVFNGLATAPGSLVVHETSLYVGGGVSF